MWPNDCVSAHQSLFCFIGVFVGTVIGVLPGIGPPGAIAMLLPTTSVFLRSRRSSCWRESITGRCTVVYDLHLGEHPGETASVVTCLDGYQMARRGRAGPALEFPLSVLHRRYFWFDYPVFLSSCLGELGPWLWPSGIFQPGGLGLTSLPT